MTTTTASRQRKPRPKPARQVRLHIRPEGPAVGAVEIAVGKQADAYLVSELPADFGRGFLVEKIGTVDAYHVNLDTGRRSCECKGFLRHGHCKHADGLAALVAAGRL